MQCAICAEVAAKWVGMEGYEQYVAEFPRDKLKPSV
jgi:hypothetical protein